MNDIAKSVIAAILVIVLGHIATISVLSTKIDMLQTTTARIETKTDKIDDRLRKVEIEQAKEPQYLAAN